jgi:hypothetical protein
MARTAGRHNRHERIRRLEPSRSEAIVTAKVLESDQDFKHVKAGHDIVVPHRHAQDPSRVAATLLANPGAPSQSA